jgi:signal transduction histidine kinase
MASPPAELDRMPPTAATRRPLVLQLALVSAVLAAVLAALLLGYVAPRTASAFAGFGDDLLRSGATTMRELLQEQTDQNADVLVDLIRRTSSARERALQDLPLEALAGDVAAIRAAIASEDQARSERLRQNVVVLTDEVQRRAERAVATRLQALNQDHAMRAEAFAAELRTSHLWLVAIALLVLLVVLGLGVHHVVVAPARRLGQATRAVAAGDLAVAVPPPSADELGDLARDFARMVEQLRVARSTQQRLTDGLAHEVQKKTAHLERALQDLRSSHQQLAQAERLASLGTLSGGIAHEFHNVIGGIRGCAHELLADETDADRRETLGVIVRAAERGAGIVHQLLRFARRSVEQQADVDPALVLQDALRLCEPAARGQQVQVERQLAAGLCVRGDADALHQVAVNLLINALQAMPNGGTLRVTAAAAPGAQPGPGDVVLTIADTGIGIAADDLRHVFEPFFTTKTSAADPNRRGSGLGLSVSYGIVTAHGGTIAVQSTPGVGTTFTIRLPQPRR